MSKATTTTLPKVSLSIRWRELFGNTIHETSKEIRRARWDEWKSIGNKSGGRARQMVNYWSRDNVEETCSGCKHRDGDWCKLQGLPCNVNPILTFDNNLIGMACMGVGYEGESKRNSTVTNKEVTQ